MGGGQGCDEKVSKWVMGTSTRMTEPALPRRKMAAAGATRPAKDSFKVRGRSRALHCAELAPNISLLDTAGQH